jgi:hypothetical protein
VGDRLKVTGLYVQDIYEGGHTEIHPVYKIESIDGSLALLLLLLMILSLLLLLLLFLLINNQKYVVLFYANRMQNQTNKSEDSD